MKRLSVLIVVVLAGLAAKPSGHAATRTWTGNVNGNWSTGLNWSGGLPPASGDDLVFPAGAARTTVTNNFSPNRPFNSITFLAPYTVHGESLILTNGLRCGHTNATVTIHAAISIAGPQSFLVTNGPATLLHLNTNLDLGVHGLTIGGNGKVEISSAISGAGGIVKNGTNVLHFHGSRTNSYLGATVVNAGTLQLNKSGGTAIAGQLVIGDGLGDAEADVVRLLAPGQIADFATVSVNSSGLFDASLPDGGSETIGALTLHNGAQVKSPIVGALVVDGPIQGSGEATSRIQGSGTLVLGGATPTIDVAWGNNYPTLDIATLIEAPSLTKTGLGWLRIGPSQVFSAVTVSQGTLEARPGTTLAQSGATVTVQSNATLRLVGGTIIGRSLVLNGAGFNGTEGALRILGAGSNTVWAGSVTLASDSTVHVTGSSYVSATQLTFSNAITGPGKFIKDGGGRLNFTGNTANTYAGGTWLRDGYFDLRKPDGTAALSGNVVIGDGNGAKTPNLHHSAAEQIANTADVTITNGSWDVSIFTETIATLNGGGGIHFGPGGKLIVNPAGAICTYQGTLTGDGELVKSGIGTLILEGSASHTGPTTVSNGVLRVNGSLTNSPIAVRGTSRLEGHGTVAAISLFDTATLSPGSSPGRLTSGALALADSGFFRVELQGPSPGADYDQLRVRGPVDLNTATLTASLGFSSSLSNQFVIIDNDGTDPVGGTFQGLPQNSLLSIGSEQFRISYSGGDGNDVVLTQVTGALRPALTIEPLPPASVRLRWPTNNSTGFILQSSTNLAATNWSVAAPPNPVVIGTNWVVTNAVTGPYRFYRLFKP